MKKEIELTEDALIHREFQRRFSSWDVPVEKVDVLLDRLPAEQRQAHYTELRDILGKKAFKRELDDWLRRISFTLSMGQNNGRVLTEIELQGLRILMLEIKSFEEVLKRRAALAQLPKALTKMSDRV